MNQAGAAVPIADDTRVRLSALMARRDGDKWVIGRPDTGDFIAIPEIGHRSIELLDSGHTVGGVRRRLVEEFGDEIDVSDFVTALVELGFVVALDDHLLDQPDPPSPSLRRLKPQHVGWLLHPGTAIVAGGLILAAIFTVIVDPALLPTYHQIIWSLHGSVVIAGNAAIIWTLIFLHELSHLATARAAGVPGKMSLSTRLQFLAAQTDVSGIWAAPRRVRITVYLAGIVFQLCVAAAGILLLATGLPHGIDRQLVAATTLLSLTFIPPQFLVFMRTDLYFVLQDLTRSTNLYADGAKYLRFHITRMWHWIRKSETEPADPTTGLTVRERYAIRAYCLVLLVGTTICIVVAATISIPATFTLIGRAVIVVAAGQTGWALADAITVISVPIFFQILWARAWWRRHGHRVRRYLPGRRQRAERR